MAFIQLAMIHTTSQMHFVGFQISTALALIASLLLRCTHKYTNTHIHTLLYNQDVSLWLISVLTVSLINFDFAPSIHMPTANTHTHTHLQFAITVTATVLLHTYTQIFVHTPTHTEVETQKSVCIVVGVCKAILKKSIHSMAFHGKIFRVHISTQNVLLHGFSWFTIFGVKWTRIENILFVWFFIIGLAG